MLCASLDFEGWVSSESAPRSCNHGCEYPRRSKRQKNCCADLSKPRKRWGAAARDLFSSKITYGSQSMHACMHANKKPSPFGHMAFNCTNNATSHTKARDHHLL
ncbi:unnamed protein product [Ectocarpus sp. 12 AP-2014]